MNKRKSATIRIILCSISAVCLTALLAVALSGKIDDKIFISPVFSLGRSFSYDDEESYSIGSAEIPADGVLSIDVKWLGGGVLIEPLYNGEKNISIREDENENDDFRMRYKVENGCLYIKPCKSGIRTHTIFGKELSRSLVIFLPESLLKEMYGISVESVSADIRTIACEEKWGIGVSRLALNTVSGSIDARYVKAKKAELSSVSGKIVTDGLFAEQLKTESVSASQTLSGRFEEIDLETVSGAVQLNLSSLPKEIKAESVSGNVEISLPQKDGFTLTAESVSGSIGGSIPSVQKNKVVYFGDTKNIGGNELLYDRLYKISSVSGGISVNCPAQ